MIFLIHYDRPNGIIVELKAFAGDAREQAANERLLIEVNLNRQGLKEREVVLLDAESQEALRRTHRRYFEGARQIMTSSSGEE
jgi:hypothetical protein